MSTVQVRKASEFDLEELSSFLSSEEIMCLENNHLKTAERVVFIGRLLDYFGHESLKWFPSEIRYELLWQELY